MSAFRRVDANEAGPRALGILVPPGLTTLVIARPRALAWDLLPARWDGDGRRAPIFCRFERDEAVAVARSLARFLDQSAGSVVNPLETFGDPAGKCLQVWLRTSEFFWIVCQRTPGQSYRPAVFATSAEAEGVAQSLVPYFWPRGSTEQEYYFNTQYFR